MRGPEPAQVTSSPPCAPSGDGACSGSSPRLTRSRRVSTVPTTGPTILGLAWGSRQVALAGQQRSVRRTGPGDFLDQVARRVSNRPLSSCPSSNLKCWPATTAPHGSLHPFRSGQILNPYASYYRPPFALSAFSYPLVQQIPLQVTCPGQTTGAGGQLDLPRSRFCQPGCCRAYPFSARLFPGSMMTTYSRVQGE